MPEQEPQPKATPGNATERLQIKYRNSRAMKTIDRPLNLIPGTNFVAVRPAIPPIIENQISSEQKEEKSDEKPQE